MIPTIRTQTLRSQVIDGVRVDCLRFESWNGAIGSAHVYHPPLDPPTPAVLLCCGHGAGGKVHSAYQRMAVRIASAGAWVVVPDPIGLGERHPMGHWDAIGPFACGTTLQGLIVSEYRGWLDWLREQAEVDPARLAAVGNSGGGTATLFLAALEPGLAAVSSSGYPSSFEFVARKTKRHCACNILPGIVTKLEMWQVLGSFAPRPIFLFQGRNDNLFPEDLFWMTAECVSECYSRSGVGEAFGANVFEGQHGWDPARRTALVEFLADVLNMAGADAGESSEDAFPSDHTCLGGWDGKALTADRLAERLTGRKIPPEYTLESLVSTQACLQCPAPLPLRVSPERLRAQYDLFLGEKPRYRP